MINLIPFRTRKDIYSICIINQVMRHNIDIKKKKK
jgi:hypothetical protein